ncbi:MAG: hypothetical protein P3B98_03490 [Gemmatimonadota bacterium]|nr:hypothetical protein [Gemmatimonadota bacterium]
MTASDFSSFPIREGGSVPRDLILPHADALMRGHGISLKMLAARGGISVFEMLLLLPPLDNADTATHRSNVCDLTLNQALAALQTQLNAYHKRKEEEAEAEMLKMMEEGAA